MSPTTRRITKLILLALTILIFHIPICMADPLSLTVNVEKASYDKGETVVITGFVLDPNGVGVSYATISIEVTDPNENQVHVAMTISGSDGSFSDELKVPDRGAEGTYTVYISASKAGYEDANLTTNYTVIPEFGFNGSPILVLASALILILLSRRKRFTMRARANHLVCFIESII